MPCGCLRISFSITSTQDGPPVRAPTAEGDRRCKARPLPRSPGAPAADIGAGKTRGAGGDGSWNDRRAKAVHHGRAERRHRLRFRRRHCARPAPVPSISSIRRRRKWPLLGNSSGTSANAESGNVSLVDLPKEVPGGETRNSSSRNNGRSVTPFIGSEPVDDGHVHPAGHDQLAQHMAKTVVDMDDDLRDAAPSFPSGSAATARSTSNRSQARSRPAPPAISRSCRCRSGLLDLLEQQLGMPVQTRPASVGAMPVLLRSKACA